MMKDFAGKKITEVFAVEWHNTKYKNNWVTEIVLICKA